jgi:hypothetical protein
VKSAEAITFYFLLFTFHFSLPSHLCTFFPLWNFFHTQSSKNYLTGLSVLGKAIFASHINTLILLAFDAFLPSGSALALRLQKQVWGKETPIANAMLGVTRLPV